ILFEGTMDGEVRGRPTAAYLWEERQVVPFVKVDRGLEPEKDGVQLMRPMPQLDQLCDRAVKLGVFGTKMRSVINLASKEGLAANHGMIASFSRALVQDLRVSMSDAEFETALAQSVDEIHRASTVKA